MKFRIILLDDTIIEADNVIQASQSLGDVNLIYERCGNTSGIRIYCPDCQKKGRVSHCGNLFFVDTIRGGPGPIEISFADGSAILAKSIEEL